VANVAYEVVKDPEVTPEIGYYDPNLGESDSDDGFGDFLRLQRNF
jgi:hypothetical protein